MLTGPSKLGLTDYSSRNCEVNAVRIKFDAHCDMDKTVNLLTGSILRNLSLRR